jgi:hypothetical protein
MATADARSNIRMLPSAFPSKAALALEQASRRELEVTMRNGTLPDINALAGWEFRGHNNMLELNAIPFAELAGIKKFVKGFHRDERGKVMGYNAGVVQNARDGRWSTKPNDTAPKKFGFYETVVPDPTSRDNAYLHSALLHYGLGGNGLNRDYLVQVDPQNPDLFLGKAYFAIGPARIPLNYFILERFRRGLTDYAAR